VAIARMTRRAVITEDPPPITITTTIMVTMNQIISVHHSPVAADPEDPVMAVPIHGAAQEAALAIFQNIPSQRLVRRFSVLYLNLSHRVAITITIIMMRME
jgi:hypothetical protein